jgi:hypothetical protein
MSESLVKHDAIGRVHSMYDASQIDVDTLLPVARLELACLSEDDDPCVVEHVVQPVASLDRLLNNTHKGLTIDNVNLDCGRFASGCIDSSGCFASKIDLQIGKNHFASTCRQRLSKPPPDARCTPGDDGHSTIKNPDQVSSTHASPPVIPFVSSIAVEECILFPPTAVGIPIPLEQILQ